MAKMISPFGPVANQSLIAEPIVYSALAQQLPDDFTVIHSLSWLSRAAREADGRPAPTGELDFLLFHPSLGVLALEVKGGRLKCEGNRFFLPNGTVIDPIAQVRRGTHALARWIVGAGGPKYRIGYALVFPESDMQGRPLPPSLIDMTTQDPESICIDQPSLPRLGLRVIEIMRYWQRELKTWPLEDQQVAAMVNLICPSQDYSPRWSARIEDDTRQLLLLTPEQSRHLARFARVPRVVITGRSGTGKTLLAVTHARHLSGQGKRVLFLVYNVQLASRIRKQLDGTAVSVFHFHALCRQAAAKIGRPVGRGSDWFQGEAAETLKEAIDGERLPTYDALVLDEAQVFKHEWLIMLEHWFMQKHILACCDETQVFSFDHKTTGEELTRILQAKAPFLLTVNMRSPRAVFERLQQVLPTDYEQFSPRANDPDTLTECAVPNPLEQLHTTLRQLHAEGIPPQAIMVVFLGEAPRYQTEVEPYVGQTLSVYRCRGLEAPVVIIWSDGRIDDTLLSCAYSRATSRCIAIYHIHALSSQNSSVFHRLLLETSQDVRAAVQAYQSDRERKSVHLPQSVPQTVPAPVPPAMRSLHLTQVASKFAHIAWSHDWQGWLLEPQENVEDQIARHLWIYHLASTSSAPIYVPEFSKWESNKYSCYRPIDSLLDIPSRSYEFVDWCPRCQRITRRRKSDLLTQTNLPCLDCESPVQSRDVPTIARSLTEFDQEGRTRDDQDESFFLMTLRRWLKLPDEQRKHFKASQYMGRAGFEACKLLLGMDLLEMDPGQEVTLAERHEYYWQVNPWLMRHVNKAEWKTVVIASVTHWLGRGWLEKKKVGIYVRTFSTLCIQARKGGFLYKGITFHCELAARWAIFYDLLQITYIYHLETESFFLPQHTYWILAIEREPNEKERLLAQIRARFENTPVYLFSRPMPSLDTLQEGEDLDAYKEAEVYYPERRDATEDFVMDTQQMWCECPTCGMLGIRYSGFSGRLPCHHGGDQKVPNADSPQLQAAYIAARSASLTYGTGNRQK